jgi:hypothetical protein
MFKLFKKKDDSPPDVGKEELPDSVTEVSADDVPVDETPSEDIKPNISNKNSTNAGGTSVIDSLELQKIQARLESFNEIMKGFNERFSVLNQQIGEVRAMSIANEKNISRSEMESQKAVDIVKEVEPDKLRLDYQRIDMKTGSISEKIEANKQFMDSIMEEVKEIKRKAGIFEGTDAILKLSADVKKDLVELQKMAGRERMNTDKSEEIFIQLKNGFSESEKLKQMINNLDNLYVGMRKEVDKVTMERNDSLKKKDFSDFKNTMENKFKTVENAFSQTQKVNSDNEKIAEALEKLTIGFKRNEEDIANIGLTLGNDKVKRISDFENKLYSILEVLDKMAYEISRIKDKAGIKGDNVTLSSEQVFIPVANVSPIKTSENKPALIETKSVPIETKSVPIETKSVPIETKSVPIETKSVPIETKSVPIETKSDNVILNIPDSFIGKSPTPNDIKDINNVETNQIVHDNLFEKKAFETQKVDEIKTKDVSEIKTKDISELNITQDKNLLQKAEQTQKTEGFDIKKNSIPDTRPRQGVLNERMENERKINDLLLSGGYYLVRRDLSGAIKIYLEVIRIYKPAFDRNKNTYYKIMRFYENISKLSDLNEFNKEPVKEPETVVLFGQPINSNSKKYP